MSRIADYAAKTALPTIPAETVQDLERPFMEEELTLVLSSLKHNKSPGPDGYTAYFYKTFQGLLTPFMTKTFNTVSTDSPFLSQALEAHITVLPKLSKNPTLCGSYSPISLTNIDIRMYSKMIANRLTPLIPDLINLDQVGFTPGRETRDNTLKTIALMEHAQKCHIPACLISVDAEKAFDRVHWSFLQQTLQQIGVGPKLMVKILSLYMGLSAKIRSNGLLSDPIWIRNGTHKGCPLSPLLYILTIEHLAIAYINTLIFKALL